MKNINIKWIGAGSVVLAAVLWSLDALLRTKLYVLPPLTIIFAEHAIGSIIAIPILFALRHKLKKLTQKQIIAVVIVSILSGIVGTVLFTAALQKIQFIPFSVVILLQQLQPIFAITSSAILLKEKITKQFLTYAILAIGGAYMLSFPELRVNLATGGATAIAALMAVGAAASWGSSTAISKYALQNTFWLQITGIRFALATLISGLALLIIPSMNGLSAIGSEQIKTLVIIALSTGFVALGIYYYGLQKVRASRATILELAWPFTAVITGLLFFDQPLTITQWIGAVVLSTAAYMIARQEVTDTAKP